jgi:hypothetical protein
VFNGGYQICTYLDFKVLIEYKEKKNKISHSHSYSFSKRIPKALVKENIKDFNLHVGGRNRKT